jgi:NAD(P)-dependent dehydrogenase (short-subunit alcohol dehydrogenase family)
MARLVIPHMKKQQSGAIVAISSRPGSTARHAHAVRRRQWAVIGFTKSLAVESAPSASAPTSWPPVPSRVPAWAGSSKPRPPSAGSRLTSCSEYVGSQSIPRFVKPSEIADVCAFLASSHASMVNGQVIAVDGNTETFHIASADPASVVLTESTTFR